MTLRGFDSNSTTASARNPPREGTVMALVLLVSRRKCAIAVDYREARVRVADDVAHTAQKSVAFRRASYGVPVADLDPCWLGFAVCQLRMREYLTRLGRVEAKR
jgi:hypothetical protein